MTRKQKIMLLRIAAAAAMTIALMLIRPENPWLSLILYLVPYLIAGYDILRKAWKGIVKRQPFDECFLMAVATVGAFALGEYQEGAAVMIFYTYFTYTELSEVLYFGVIPLLFAFLLGFLFDMFFGKMVVAIKKA